jgi:hypothetical protein
VKEDIYSILLMVVIIVTGSAAALYIRNILTRRAVSRVLRSLRQHNATGAQGAKTLRELGLQRPSFIKKATSPRDYKQQALQILVKQGVVRANADGTVYLVEEGPEMPSE